MLSIASIILIIICISLGVWEAIFFATFISAIVSQFSQPSSSKIFKRYIPEEQVSGAIGIIQSLSSLFIIVGPIIGTAIFTSLGVLPALYILVFTFGLSTIITLFLPKDDEIEKNPASTIMKEIKEGFHYVWQNRYLKRITITFSILGFGAGLVQPLEVFLITDRLDLPKEALQWLSSIAGVGLLFGGILAAVISNKLNTKVVFASTFLAIGFATIMEVLSTSFLLTASMRFAAAFILAFVQILLSTLMITLVEEKYIGRTNGIITPIFTAALLLGSSLSGIGVQSTSLITVYIIAGIITALAAIPAFGITSEPKHKQETNGISL